VIEKAGTDRHTPEIADYLKADVHIGLAIDDGDNAVVASNTVGRQTIGVQIKDSSGVLLRAELAGAEHDTAKGDANLIVHNKTDDVKLVGAVHPIMLSTRIYDNDKGIVHDGKTAPRR
jgi:hypothetical protein